MGYQAGLRAFTAAVLGGIGNMPGAALGGLVIGFLSAWQRLSTSSARYGPTRSSSRSSSWCSSSGRPAHGRGACRTRRDDALGASLARMRRGPSLRHGAVVATALPSIVRSCGAADRPRGLPTAMIYVLLALGLNIVVGYAGLLDLGYAAFFAIGAYTMRPAELAGTRLATLRSRAGASGCAAGAGCVGRCSAS